MGSHKPHLSPTFISTSILLIVWTVRRSVKPSRSIDANALVVPILVGLDENTYVRGYQDDWHVDGSSSPLISRDVYLDMPSIGSGRSYF